MINISIDDPKIPEDAGFYHIATSWQVATSKDFENDLLIESMMNTVNLLEYKSIKVVDEDQVLFARAMIHYSNGDVTPWSRTITLSADQKGFKLSNTIIVTPEIFIDESHLDVTNDEIKVHTSPYKLYAGTGKHKSTTWKITTILGEHVWSRVKDEDRLTSIVIPKGKLDSDKMYILNVTFHSDTNTSSNPGKLPFNSGKIKED